MKRSAMQRRTPLRAKGKVTRRAPVRRKPSSTKHARRERAPSAWFEWVKSQPCFVSYLDRLFGWGHLIPSTYSHLSAQVRLRLTPCLGVVEADHMGSKMRDGDGERAYDYTCVSICTGHHMERHDFAGTFKEFCQDDMRAFLAAGIAWMHARAREQGVEIPNV